MIVVLWVLILLAVAPLLGFALGFSGLMPPLTRRPVRPSSRELP